MVYFSCISDRFYLGKTHVGNLVDLGCTLNFCADSIFLYLGFIALQSVITDQQNRDRAGAVIALVGVINLPIIHYSVIWWNTLHQGPTISQFAKPSIAPHNAISIASNDCSIFFVLFFNFIFTDA